ncbi:hypothetical protein JZO70_21305 [Enterococcus sp. 669A]|uniref:Uncharacterized protein n=1 Tax=Candidatus Enterococcus moelleringii TaxID=2815325 RepID=A0ABS3LGH6_9ENTE|nr:hypothetical protein [Enterococcus sp. 669A]MBO1308725.1 hypothetical protein [Enterococcus sp. 669A]
MSGGAYFRIFGGNWLFTILLMIFCFFMTYGLFASVAFVIKTLAKDNDELDRKTFMNALAASFVFIMVLHLVQMLVRRIYSDITGQDINILVKPGMLLYAFDKPQTHLESFLVDLGVFGIILFINRLRYEELNFRGDIRTLVLTVLDAFR